MYKFHLNIIIILVLIIALSIEVGRWQFNSASIINLHYGYLLCVFLLIILARLYIKEKKIHIQDLIKQNAFLRTQQLKIKENLGDIKEKNLLLKNQIDYQSTELLEHIIIKEKIDVQLKEVLNIIKKKANCEQEMELVQAKITDLHSASTGWIGFKEKINSVYPNFFKNLYEIHPILSKNDLKHCTFILIGIPVKEVCSILSVSPKTVESARYRIRKKMNIPLKQKTKEYLFSLL